MVAKYKIEPWDIINMDEKGFIMGIALTAKVIQHRAYRGTFIQ